LGGDQEAVNQILKLIERRFSSGERQQAPAEFVGVLIRNKLLDFVVSAFPEWKRTSKKVASIVCEFQDAGSPI
jgi:hypothetical protein